ncbi:uncharacterized protein LOC18428830 isoform X2 [Amborella trichopoda]|uniref:uncharacterized protein LOC18428830 isoform X2 n=1 Tax=Amborella trichopoda TaxID=13333 RepID=UPI0009BE7865|nr:uncharacterized protein LOC18428830 isoform X2 [Amborella trichopoda]|eukprot:XP_020519614.1 uncharacterized protein LOC18428830 isoform X2 [Amborella trichopoda]
MAEVGADAEEEKPNFIREENQHSFQSHQKPEEEIPWIEYAVQEAESIKKTLMEATDSALEATRSRLFDIHATSSAHFYQAKEALLDVKTKYSEYEDSMFGKVKGPRRYLFNSVQRLFVSEESMLASAEAKVKELRQSIELVKNESKKLEERARLAEEEMRRGQTKLRHAGHQIQTAIHSAYKIEKQARGLKDILGELPRREASRFRSQVSKMASEAKRERDALGKEVTKITNYGIPI